MCKIENSYIQLKTKTIDKIDTKRVCSFSLKTKTNSQSFTNKCLSQCINNLIIQYM